MSNREKATKFAAEKIGKIIPGSDNEAIVLNRLNALTDKQFAQLVDDIKNGRAFMHLICANGAEDKIDTDRNIQLAAELGVKLYDKVWTYNKLTGRRNLSVFPRYVASLPVRRLIQMLEYKLSVAKDNKHIDQRTDQATGISKASAVSAPEINMLSAQGYDATIRELVKYRGGDLQGMHLMDSLIQRDGTVRQETLDRLGTRSKAPEVANHYLTAMHLRNNF